MHRFRPRLTYANTIATFALVLAASGGAYAAVSSIPGPDGVIHSCYARRTGALRVVRASKPCSKAERALSFDERGQQGLRGLQGAPGSQGTQGLQGAQGPQGAQGSRGPSDVFVADGAGSTNLPASNATVQVATLNVAAGEYLVNGQTQILNGGAGTVAAICSISPASGSGGVGQASVPGSGAVATVPALSTVLLPSAGAITLDCHQLSGGAGVNTQAQRLTAIQVARVNGS